MPRQGGSTTQLDAAVQCRNLSGPPALFRDPERNRGNELVGFKIDAKRRLIGDAWVPKADLMGSEFTAYLHAVATECDRFEYQLTGSDAS